MTYSVLIKRVYINPCFVLVVDVDLSSGRWLKYKRPSERIASIVVNGKEMSQNRKGMNVVLLNYLTGKFFSDSTLRGQPTLSSFFFFLKNSN